MEDRKPYVVAEDGNGVGESPERQGGVLYSFKQICDMLCVRVCRSRTCGTLMSPSQQYDLWGNSLWLR
jgi:hypothetical protein